MSTTKEQTDREKEMAAARVQLFKSLGEKFDCEPETYAIACGFVNKQKCYKPAAALITGLSVRRHLTYIDKCAAALKEYHEQNGLFEFDVATMHAWIEYYDKEVEAIPTE